ncbi:MAG: hypothetical protein FIB08_16190 [Candidatus Methanoperedens sp.]|nr:hypothetical protein [Candidatus Methanoperedens sp.]
MENKIRTVLVSPHSDDIAYSIGGALLQDYFYKPVLMVTIFTKSNFTRSNFPLCVKLDNSEIISKMRHLEDVQFTTKNDMRFLSFPFPEASMRGISRQEMFSNVIPDSYTIFSDVYLALSGLIKTYACDLIVSPMGLGNHIDHIMVSDICNKIAHENNKKIVFYEDLPYASFLTSNKIKTRANTISPDLKPFKVDISEVYKDKLTNLDLYKTQIRSDFRARIKFHALRLSIENEGLLKQIWPQNIIRYLLFLSGDRCRGIYLFERLWANKPEGMR